MQYFKTPKYFVTKRNYLLSARLSLADISCPLLPGFEPAIVEEHKFCQNSIAKSYLDIFHAHVCKPYFKLNSSINLDENTIV